MEGSDLQTASRPLYTDPGLTKKALLEMYRKMVLSRTLDERIWQLNRQGKAAIVASCQGHEAAQLACVWALRPGHDLFYIYYRDLPAIILLGVTLIEIMLGFMAKAIADLTTRGRDGKLTLPDVQGRTFTVNNTGALGSISSQPLVNPPQATILTTEAIVKRPVVIDDTITIRSMMNVCLAFDHRILDGSEAGAFMANVKSRLEAIGPETGIY